MTDLWGKPQSAGGPAPLTVPGWDDHGRFARHVVPPLAAPDGAAAWAPEHGLGPIARFDRET